MSETQIVSSILEAANYYGFFWRNNTGALPINTSGRTRFIRFGMRGSADIIGLVQGRFVAIEVKTKTGKQSEHQREFQMRVEKSGGIYALVRSSCEALELIKKVKDEN